jgi:hypothetical protein
VYAHRGLAIALVMLVAYLVFPQDFSEPVGILIVSGRFAPVVMFFFLLSAPVPSRDWRRWLALPAIPIALIALLNVTTKYRTFAEYMRPLPRLVAKCDPHDDVLTLSMDPQTFPSVSELAPFRLLPSWVQVLHGGYAPDSWPRPIPFPFIVKQALPAPSWMGPQPAPQFLNGPYQCVLAHRLQQALPHHQWKLRGREGEWTVYHRK